MAIVVASLLSRRNLYDFSILCQVFKLCLIFDQLSLLIFFIDILSFLSVECHGMYILQIPVFPPEMNITDTEYTRDIRDQRDMG